ncbi:MAG: PQQ-dependent sugar dehydrogenase [Gammaproteobacteria bacterium]|nr:PQQ-dependent sugar dehydrogenase [Gammaproteobacteria bacterium]MDP6616047.1 PQQ-dependent sugar dehydrogenase [Gammaproteobacteria bacterium]MDP6695478.1 PQQ-dependent sugar dehydrogenase [Gammaproteobacteria bacterium]
MKTKPKIFLAVLALAGNFVLGIAPAAELTTANLDDQVRLPDGFRIEQIAEVRNARAMVLGEGGTLFVSAMVPGNVYAVTDFLGADPQVRVLAEKLSMPTGIAYRDGDLYVAESTRIFRYTDIEAKLDAPGEPQLIADNIPGGKLHGWKYIDFGPDGLLYVTVGAPCNVCNEPGTALILRMRPDGSGREVYAEGIRNSVGFDWHPDTGTLWFTENGRDGMGDDVPKDELNSAPEKGLHFGFPFCHATNVVEPSAELASLGSCATSRAPALELGPHVAALGIVFYTGDMFPAEYRNQAFIAEHGSWNRSERIGYRVSLVRFSDPDTVASYETFAEGWLQDGEILGRPVAVTVIPDGSLLVSDDRRGAIYRISYSAD